MLKGVNEAISLKSSDMSAYQQFFDMEGKVFKLNNEVCAEIKDYIFALPFPFGILQLNMVFLDECYNMCEVQNGFVIDIGTFIGETAVYFTSKGARKVLAFEPAPSLFHLAEQNVLLNHLENVIEVRNDAVSNEEGFMDFDYIADAPYASFLASENELNSSKSTKMKVKVTPFSDIMRELDYVDCLKMNCEGAEYKILKQAYEENLFQKIGSIMVQVHGPDEIVCNYLKKGSYTIVNERKAGGNLTDIYAVKN